MVEALGREELLHRRRDRVEAVMVCRGIGTVAVSETLVIRRDHVETASPMPGSGCDTGARMMASRAAAQAWGCRVAGLAIGDVQAIDIYACRNELVRQPRSW